MLPDTSDRSPYLDVEEVRSLDYTYYATGLVAVYQLLKVMHAVICTEKYKLTRLL
jgi:hypothetical protein